MNFASAIEAGQGLAEERMTERCKIVRPSQQVTLTNGDDVFEEIHIYGFPGCPWNGKCEITTYEPDAAVIQSGGRPIETQEYRIKLPKHAGPFHMGDLATVEGHPHPYRIDGLFNKTYATAQRLKATVQANKVVSP